MTTKQLTTVLELIDQLQLTKKGEEQLAFAKTMIPTESDSKTIKTMKLAALKGMLNEIMDPEKDSLAYSDMVDANLLKGVDYKVLADDNAEYETEEEEDAAWSEHHRIKSGYEDMADNITRKIDNILSA